MTNYQIADHFSLLSKLMDIHGENSFKSKSYSTAAFNIEKLPAEASSMDMPTLASMKGIGESTCKKITELLTTGKLQVLDELIANTPAGILDMLQIKGLGPKKIAVIWNELGIESLGELEYACNENRLVTLKGFGAKTQESVLQNIVYFKQNIGFYLWAEAEQFAKALLDNLKNNFPLHKFDLAGAIRRQLETLEFVDLVTDLPAETISTHFKRIEGATIATEPELVVSLPASPKIRFHTTTSSNYYTTLWANSGSEDFLTAFTAQYQLPVAPESEEAIFTHNHLPYLPPMLREDADLLQSTTLTNTIHHLIRPTDIKGIIHSHSTWSDGVHTLEEMARAAKDKGYEYLVISDHSQTAVYADGLKPDKVAAQHQEIDRLNLLLAPFKIFKSIESDILGDGSLDYSNQVLATFDMVIASVHSNLKMTEEKAMERVLTAIRNPYTTVLGHPTGRLLLSRKGYPLDHKLVIDTCAAHNVAIEINAHPKRLDIDWRWVRYAMNQGVLLSINPDAHSIDGYKDTYYGVMVAQKGCLSAARNLSSFSLAQLEEHLAEQRLKR